MRCFFAAQLRNWISPRSRARQSRVTSTSRLSIEFWCGSKLDLEVFSGATAGRRARNKYLRRGGTKGRGGGSVCRFVRKRAGESSLEDFGEEPPGFYNQHAIDPHTKGERRRRRALSRDAFTFEGLVRVKFERHRRYDRLV